MKKMIYTIILCFASIFCFGQNNNFGQIGQIGADGRPQQGKDSIQKKGSSDSTKLHIRKLFQWERNGVYQKRLPSDSSFTSFHINNLIFLKSISNTYLSTNPSPYESNIFIDRNSKEDFYWLSNIQAYILKPEDNIIYNTTTPYTELRYQSAGQDGKQEVNVEFLHTQNINPFWNIGTKYYLLRTDGRYMYSGSKAYNFTLFSNYNKGRYAVDFFINQNNGYFNENGGVQDRNVIRDTTESAENVLVNLSEGVKNKYRNFNFSTRIHYNIGNPKVIITGLKKSSSIKNTAIDTVFENILRKEALRIGEIVKNSHKIKVKLNSNELSLLKPDNFAKITSQELSTLSPALLSMINPKIIDEIKIKNDFNKSMHGRTMDITKIDTTKTHTNDKDLNGKDTNRKHPKGKAPNGKNPNKMEQAELDSTVTYPAKFVFSVNIEDDEHSFRESTVNTDFFKNTYYTDQTTTLDRQTARIYRLSAKFVLNEHPKYKYLPGLYAGLDYENLVYKKMMAITDTELSKNKYSNTYINIGTFNMDSTTLLNYDINAKFCLTGDYSGSFNMNGYIIQYFSKKRDNYLKIDGKIYTKNINTFLQDYVGNHNIWHNNFKNIKVISLKGKYINKKYKFEGGLGVNSLFKHIYFDTIAQPIQTDKNITILSGWIKKSFKLRHFHFDQQVYFQKSSQEKILDLPKITLYSSNYYQNYAFSKALRLRIGLDLYYHTKFYSQNYMPSTMQFHNQIEEETGNYPKIDIFADFRIKRADIYFKYEHASFYISNRNYFSALDYPINPPMLKFGLKWRFYN